MTVLARIPAKLKIELGGETVELAEYYLPVEGRVTHGFGGANEVRISVPTHLLDELSYELGEILVRKFPKEWREVGL